MPISNTENLISEPAKIKKTALEMGQTLLFWAAILVGLGWYFDIHKPEKTTVFCDMETVKAHKAIPYLFKDGNYFGIGGERTDRFAKSRKYSVVLSKKQPYGIRFDIPKLKGPEKITASIWRFSDGRKGNSGALTAQVDGDIFWKSGNKIVEKSEDGWEKIELSFELPYRAQGKKLSIYCRNPASFPIYFDDLKIEIDLRD